MRNPVFKGMMNSKNYKQQIVQDKRKKVNKDFDDDYIAEELNHPAEKIAMTTIETLEHMKNIINLKYLPILFMRGLSGVELDDLKISIETKIMHSSDIAELEWVPIKQEHCITVLMADVLKEHNTDRMNNIAANFLWLYENSINNNFKNQETRDFDKDLLISMIDRMIEEV